MREENKSKLHKNTQRYGYLFISLWLLGIIVFFALPLFQSLYYSFCDVKITGAGRLFFFNSGKNYSDIFVKDIYYLRRLLNFLMSTVLKVPLILVISMVLSLMLNQPIRFRGFYRTIFFLPIVIVSGPVIDELNAQGSTTIPLVSDYGIYQLLQNTLPEWMAEPIGSLFSQLIIILWYTGIPVLIYIAGLQQIDLSLYEAGKIDGGNSWELFWKITMPAMKGFTLLNGIYLIVFLSNSSQNEVINLISRDMIDPQKGYGYASAMSWLHTIVVFILLGIFMLLFMKKRQRRLKG